MIRWMAANVNNQGGPSGAVLAYEAPSTAVTVVDVDEARIAAWNSDILPIQEPGLAEVVFKARDGIPGVRTPNLSFSTDVDGAIAGADLIFLSVNTPTKSTGLGAGKASDLGWLEAATRRIAKVACHDTIVVEKSTVPCGTAMSIRQILSATGRKGLQFEVLSNPEFLAEGCALQDLRNPDRILIGCQQTDQGYRAAAQLTELYAQWVPTDRILIINDRSSELSKLAANALLAQRISSINALSAICEAVHADIRDVSLVCGSDKRIGPGMLNASIGFGGSCFKKDILSLVYIAESLGLHEVAAYFQVVIDLNEYQKSRFTTRIVRTMHGTLYNKRIAIFGLAYKKNTGDTRESAAMSVVNQLRAENAIVSIFDPQVPAETISRELQLGAEGKGNSRVQICSSPYEACQNAHAVVILTEWDMFRTQLPARGRGLAIPDLQSPRSTVEPTPSPTDADGYSETAGSSNGSIVSDHSKTEEESDSNSSHSGYQPTSDTVRNDASAAVDWQRISQIMERPMFVFDGRNIVDPALLKRYGFRVESIGSSSF